MKKEWCKCTCVLVRTRRKGDVGFTCVSSNYIRFLDFGESEVIVIVISEITHAVYHSRLIKSEMKKGHTLDFKHFLS